MIYYELSYFEQGECLLESSIKFLVTNKEHFSDDRMKRQQNFHKYYSKLLDYNFRNEKSGIDDMVDQLQSNIILIERRWLLSKAIDLGKSNTQITGYPPRMCETSPENIISFFPNTSSLCIYTPLNPLPV